MNIATKTRSTTSRKKNEITPEEYLRVAELRLEGARFELERINDLMNRKKFVKTIQKDAEKLSRAMRRQRRAEMKIDEYEDLILNLKKRIEEKTAKSSAT